MDDTDVKMRKSNHQRNYIYENKNCVFQFIYMYKNLGDLPYITWRPQELPSLKFF